MAERKSVSPAATDSAVTVIPDVTEDMTAEAAARASTEEVTAVTIRDIPQAVSTERSVKVDNRNRKGLWSYIAPKTLFYYLKLSDVP